MDTKVKPTKKKRTWHYLFEPKEYEVYCDNGIKRGEEPNTNHKTTWSEWAGMIWCYDCKLDMPGFGGVFDGPIPEGAMEMIMGPICFHRYSLTRKIIQEPYHTENKILYRKAYLSPRIIGYIFSLQKQVDDLHLELAKAKKQKKK